MLTGRQSVKLKKYEAIAVSSWQCGPWHVVQTKEQASILLAIRAEGIILESCLGVRVDEWSRSQSSKRRNYFAETKYMS